MPTTYINIADQIEDIKEQILIDDPNNPNSSIVTISELQQEIANNLEGLTVKGPVKVATTQPLTNESFALSGYTYLNFLTITQDNAADGIFLLLDYVNIAQGDRILLKNELNSYINGIYTLTDPGNGSTIPWVLTRSTDADIDAELRNGSYVFIESGTVNGGTSFVLSCDGELDISLNESQVWNKFSSVAFNQQIADNTASIQDNATAISANTTAINSTNSTLTTHLTAENPHNVELATLLVDPFTNQHVSYGSAIRINGAQGTTDTFGPQNGNIGFYMATPFTGITYTIDAFTGSVIMNGEMQCNNVDTKNILLQSLTPAQKLMVVNNTVGVEVSSIDNTGNINGNNIVANGTTNIKDKLTVGTVGGDGVVIDPVTVLNHVSITANEFMELNTTGSNTQYISLQHQGVPIANIRNTGLEADFINQLGTNGVSLESIIHKKGTGQVNVDTDNLTYNYDIQNHGAAKSYTFRHSNGISYEIFDDHVEVPVNNWLESNEIRRRTNAHNGVLIEGLTLSEGAINGVDIASLSNQVKQPVLVSSQSEFIGTFDNNYNNGTFQTSRITLTANGNISPYDGIVVNTDDRILIRHQSDVRANGIYRIVQRGTTSTPAIFERSTDMDSNPVDGESQTGCSTLVLQGTDTGKWFYVTSGNGPLNLVGTLSGLTPIIWTEKISNTVNLEGNQTVNGNKTLTGLTTINNELNANILSSGKSGTAGLVYITDSTGTQKIQMFGANGIIQANGITSALATDLTIEPSQNTTTTKPIISTSDITANQILCPTIQNGGVGVAGAINVFNAAGAIKVYLDGQTETVRAQTYSTNATNLILDPQGAFITTTTKNIDSTANIEANSMTIQGVGVATVNDIKFSNYAAISAPTASNDGLQGYVIGSNWVDITADKAYVALDVTNGAAVWKETTSTGGGGGGLDITINSMISDGGNTDPILCKSSLIPDNTQAVIDRNLGSVTDRWVLAYTSLVNTDEIIVPDDGGVTNTAQIKIGQNDTGFTQLQGSVNTVRVLCGGFPVASFGTNGLTMMGLLIAQSIYVGGTVNVPSGTVNAPTIHSQISFTTGIYYPAVGEMAITCGGVEKCRFKSSGISTIPGTQTAPSLTFGTSATGFYSSSANAVQASISGVEKLRITNTGVELPGGDDAITVHRIEFTPGAYGSGIFRDVGNNIVSTSYNGIQSTFISPVGDFYGPTNTYKPGGGVWQSVCDSRLKTSISATVETEAITRIQALNPIKFNYIPEYCTKILKTVDTKYYNSFIAQEFELIYPDYVSTGGQMDDLYPEGDPRNFETDGVTPIVYKTIDTSPIQNDLVKVCQYLISQNTAQQTLIDTMTATINAHAQAILDLDTRLNNAGIP